MNELIKALIFAYSTQFGVAPDFAMAVAHIESRCVVTGQEFRAGKIGRKGHYGPMGINRCFLKRGWRINDLEENIKIGVRALKGGNPRNVMDQRRVLKRYNATFSESYWKAVKAAERRYGKEIKSGRYRQRK